jgi:hypothetical protein
MRQSAIQAAVDLLGAREHPTGHQDGQGQENSGAGNRRGRAEERWRVLEQPQSCQEPVGAAIHRIDILADPHTFFGRGLKSGQFWVRTWRCGWRWRRVGRGPRTGQSWGRISAFSQAQIGLNRRIGFPSQTPQEFSDRLLTHAETPRDLALRVAFGFELLDQPLPGAGQARAPTGIATALP